MATVGTGTIQSNPAPTATGIAYSYMGQTAYKVNAKCKVKCTSVGVNQMGDVTAYLFLKMSVWFDRGPEWIPSEERYFKLDEKTHVLYTFTNTMQRYSTPDTTGDSQPDWLEKTSDLNIGLTHISPVFVQYDLVVVRNGSPPPVADVLSVGQVDDVTVPESP